MTVMLEARNLVKHFGAVKAVNDISLTVEKGEVLGFLGPNGAGKSTTMKMLTGFLEPTSGSAHVASHNVADEPIAAKSVLGYLPEGAPAWADMTPASFLSFIADSRGLSGPEKSKAIEDAVQKVHISAVLNRPIETLSKGYQRRVGLAQAILHDPDVLILDEPTDGLDPNQKHEVRELIASMRAEKAIIISTHILEEVEALCTRAVIIDRGRVVLDGTPAELKARSNWNGAVSIQLGQDQLDAANDVLKGMAGLKSLKNRHDEKKATITLFPKDSADLLAPAQKALSKAKITYETIHVHEGRLDDVFRTVTHGDLGDGQSVDDIQSPKTGEDQ